MFGAAVIVALLSVSHFSQPNGLPAKAVVGACHRSACASVETSMTVKAHVVVDRQPAVQPAVVVDVDSARSVRGGWPVPQRAKSALCVAFPSNRRCPAGSRRPRSGALRRWSSGARGRPRRGRGRRFRRVCPRNSSNSAPWLKTVVTPMPRNRSRVACAHCSGSARRMGPGRIDSRCAREEGARDRGEELHGRLADEADRCGSVVDDAVGDVLRRARGPPARDGGSTCRYRDRAPPTWSGPPVIAADSAAASTVTSSSGRQAPSPGWPLRGRRRCRS